MKGWIISLLVFLLVSSMFFVVLYQYTGLKYYLKATSYINNLPQERKIVAKNDFYGDISNKNLYNGTLAGIATGKFSGIWVWGKSGLKYFSVDQNSAYSFYNACTDKILNATNEERKSLKVQKNVYFDLNEFKTLTKTGDFIIIMTTDETKSKLIKTVKEAWDYNYWGFIQTDLKTQCEK